MLQDLFAARADLQAVEKIGVIDFFAFFGNFILEEPADHKLVQGLAKTPRAREQRHFRVALDQVADQQRLIDKVSVPVDQRFKVLYADGDFLLFFCIAHLSVPFVCASLLLQPCAFVYSILDFM